MGGPLRRLCVRNIFLFRMTLKCNTQRAGLRGCYGARGVWYNSIPITLMGTALHNFLFARSVCSCLGYGVAQNTANLCSVPLYQLCPSYGLLCSTEKHILPSL